MIFSVEKRRFRKAAKVRETRCYYLRYRFGEMPVDHWKSLGVTDKQVAEKKAREFQQEKEREAAGILEPQIIREAAKLPVKAHLDDYVADLERRARAGRGGRGARLLKGRVLRLIESCGWQLAYQVTPDSFTTWRNQRKDSARTLNHYLQGMVSFLNWMERVGRLKTNPLKYVAKVDERGQRKRIRRAFTDEELRKLVNGSGPRGIVYLTAARTGLRQEELRQLTWGDLNLEGEPPFVVVREASAKNKKEERVPLLPEVVEALRSHRAANSEPADLVFPNGIPRASRLKVDAEKNGIQYRDECGRYADFHALRYTWATFLQRNGVAQRFAMKLMRHSDIKLTAKVYTDETQLPIYESIKDLPRVGYTQIRAQILGADGQNESQPVASAEGQEQAKTPVNGGVRHGLAQCVAGGEMERAKGFEPAQPTSPNFDKTRQKPRCH
jgi:integrase